MHLQTIKLAGFKSFVDPTVIDIHPGVTVIVGPNGCGKSNILDAVRWVIGESVAHRLRVDENRDFIFNGAGTRAPASRASVELLFDNQDGRVGGEYAAYAELSVRRDILTEGPSQYFLNGKRCRRRDVRDVFLGTGFGTRGYSIIQQDWISSLVNANPETLREHLEEAAGVSKYQARRHETLNKLNLTIANLERIRLKQEDLAKEIRTLKTQATKARRFQEITEKLNSLQARSTRHRLNEKQSARENIQDVSRSIEQQLDEIDSRNAAYDEKINRFDALLSRQQEEQDAIAERRIEATTWVNSLGNQIQQLNAAHDAASIDIQDKCSLLSEALSTLESDVADLMDLKVQRNSIEGELDDIKSRRESVGHELAVANRETESLDGLTSVLEEKAAGIRKRISDIESQCRIDESAIANLTNMLDVVAMPNVELGDLETKISDIQHLIRKDMQAKNEMQEKLAQIEADIGENEQRRAECRNAIESLDKCLQPLREEQLRLKTLQNMPLSQNSASEHLDQWLLNSQLDQNLRIGAMLEVSEGWETAVEIVLGARIQAIATRDFDQHRQSLAGLQKIDIALWNLESNENHTENLGPCRPLASKLVGENAKRFTSLFKGVFACADYAQALEVVPYLESNQCVVTKDGAWMGKDWVYLFRAEHDELGVIERNRRIVELTQKIDAIELEISMLNRQHEQVAVLSDRLTGEKETVQASLNAISANLIESRTLLNQYKMQHEQRRQALDELLKNRTGRQDEIEKLRKKLADGTSQIASMSEKQEETEKKIKENRLKSVKAECNRAEKQRVFDSVVGRSQRIEQGLTQLIVKQEYLERSQDRQELIVRRLLSELSRLIQADNEKLGQLPELQIQHQTSQEDLRVVEFDLVAKNRELRETQQTLANAREEKNQLVPKKDKLIGSLTEFKTQQAELTIEINQLTAELDRYNGATSAAEDLNEDSFNSHVIEQEIETLSASLRQLGLINYRATTDLEERIAEKEALDLQIEDLASAMATMQEVMKRIDNESKRSLRETFDAVNTNLNKLFSVLFGGGAAKLEFTEADILKAGIIIRAQPPGKRNSTINMLSGGERAMVAIAFVFALFELNPSPVCVLDEVDAPLDERNVAIFSKLLAEMRSKTQFVVITHNPATMELAGNLLGVTMEEPGVSRLVAVNLEDAYAMAANQ